MQGQNYDGLFVPNNGGDDGVEADEAARLLEFRQFHRNLVKDHPPKEGKYTVFVGNAHRPFTVPKTALDICDLLDSGVKSDHEIKRYINLFEISEDEFIPMHEYLCQGDFTPHLIEQGHSQQLEGVITQSKRDEAAERIARIYHTASRMRLEPLELIYGNKLKVLYPLSPATLLRVMLYGTRAEQHRFEGEDEMREWLIDHVAGHLLVLIETEGPTLKRLLQGNPQMKQEVFRKLADGQQTGEDGCDDD